MALKILIVDDDQLTGKLLTSRLESLGHSVIVATDGNQALKKAVSESPDVILMDILLPDMQGADVVKMLQVDIDISRTKIIFLSAIIDPDNEEEQEIQVGGEFYPAIPKPVDFTKLLVYLSSLNS